MSACIETLDPRGIRVVCHDDQWTGHIVDGHPEMAGHLDWIRETVEEPMSIYQSDTHADRRVYYRPYPFAHWQWPCFLRVVIAFERRGFSRTLRGTIITAFPTVGPKPTEVLLWPT